MYSLVYWGSFFFFPKFFVQQNVLFCFAFWLFCVYTTAVGSANAVLQLRTPLGEDQRESRCNTKYYYKIKSELKGRRNKKEMKREKNTESEKERKRSASLVLCWVPLLSNPTAQCCRRACSVAKSCLTLCDPMDCSVPGSSVLQYLLEFAQTSCPLSRWCYLTISSSATFCPQLFPASGSFPVSWLFASRSQSIGASAYRFLRDKLGGLVFPSLQEFSTVVIHTVKSIYPSSECSGAQPSLWYNSHIHIWLLEKTELRIYGPLLVKKCLCFLSTWVYMYKFYKTYAWYQ